MVFLGGLKTKVGFLLCIIIQIFLKKTDQQSLSCSRHLDNLAANWFVLVDGDQIPGIAGKHRQRKITLYKDGDSGSIKVIAGISIVVNGH